jgi:hypothetical protein
MKGFTYYEINIMITGENGQKRSDWKNYSKSSEKKMK